MEKINAIKIKISEKTLAVRISRGEEANNILFRKTRKYSSDLKDYYGINLVTNSLEYAFDGSSLEEWARKYGFLKAYEELV